MMMTWMRGLTLAGLGLTMTVGGAWAQDRDSNDRPPADLPGPIDNPRDLQDTARLVFMMADTNHDGQISKREATHAGNRLVGGFFFEADANGDGALTQDEAREARQQVLNRQPILRLLIEEARKQKEGESQPNPFQGLASLVDVNNDQQVQAAEVRRAVQSGVDGLYAQADTNRDGQMSAAEVNAAAIGMGRAAGVAAFRAADKDGNGSVSSEEFEQSLVEPARVIFGAVDSDNNGEIDEEEAQRAQSYIMQRVSRLQGPRGDDAAPVPHINVPQSGASGEGSDDADEGSDDGEDRSRASSRRPVRQPATTAPGTVVPGTAVPGTVVPGTAVPGTTIPAPARVP